LEFQLTKYHLNPKTGNASLCKADEGNCPFGGEDSHFSTAEIAREVYEKGMTNPFHTPNEPASLSLNDLNREAKTTNSFNVMKEAIEKGSPRTLRNLAKNENVPDFVLEKAYERAQEWDDNTTKVELASHSNFPIEILEPETFAKAYERASLFDRDKRFLKNDSLTDAHMKELASSSANSWGTIQEYVAVSNPNNKISKKYIEGLTKTNPNYLIMKAAVESNKYSIAENIESLNNKNLRPVIDYVKDPKDLDAIARKAIESPKRESKDYPQDYEAEGNKWLVARNENTTDETLSAITDSTESTDALISVYRNSNASQATKANAIAKNKYVKSYDKVKTLDDQNGGQLKNMIISEDQNASTGQSQQARAIAFNKEAVERLNLSEIDIDSFVRFHQGNYLFGAQYDKESAIYRGYID
jgi:hypothetical protein